MEAQKREAGMNTGEAQEGEVAGEGCDYADVGEEHIGFGPWFAILYCTTRYRGYVPVQ